MNETIQNFACDLQKLLDAPVKGVPLPLSGAQRKAEQEATAFFLQLPGDWDYALQIEAQLSMREKRMLARIAHEYVNQVTQNVELVSIWLSRVTVGGETGEGEQDCPQIIEDLFKEGQIYYPYLLNGALLSGSQEVLENYFGSFVQLFQYENSEAQAYTALLVRMADEPGEGQYLQELIKEWAEGLALLLGEELGREMPVGGSFPVASPSGWAAAVEAMQREFEMYTPFYRDYASRRPVFVPWSFPAEKLVSLIPVQHQKQFVQTYVQDLPDATRFLHDKEGLKTLRAFFEQNLNVSETARVLHVHRNTLLYRLDKVKALTGLDPKNFEEAFLIKVLLLVIEQI